MFRTVAVAALAASAAALVAPRASTRSTLRMAASNPTFGAKIGGDTPVDWYLENSDTGALAQVKTFAAHCVSYIDQDGVQWMGKRSDYTDDGSKPIAGGVPICFPQFGPGALPQHGFVRGMQCIPEERAKKLRFDRMYYKFLPTEETKRVWPYDFELRYQVTLFADCMEFDAQVINEDSKEMEITFGLHTYFDVTSLANAKVTGLSGAQTIDRNMNNAPGTEMGDVVVTGPIDKMYQGVTSATLEDTGKGKKMLVEGTKGFTDIVVWNPYDPSMGSDKFLCVEAVAASSPIRIAPGATHEFSMRLTPQKL
eukprot:CAMPEP_0198419538 /NCGR_PEP_ID=MMETSP1452-20131203/280_1 /TAXON_ID=1181717 /ORGANISM="Synchroma pusillum, Strain CCMP3072" /LENGTH=309 /DNA_ID=CAMNT_0044139669 /DNA_START=28 /DNA_END=957 /DNA_ORIENTATION=-